LAIYLFLQLEGRFRPLKHCTLVAKGPLVYYLQNYERMNLADALVPRMYTEGERIIKQGDAADGMYFVEDGTVRIIKIDANGMEKEVCLI